MVVLEDECDRIYKNVTCFGIFVEDIVSSTVFVPLFIYRNRSICIPSLLVGYTTRPSFIMRASSLSQDEDSEVKTSGRRTKRKERRPSTAKDENRISEKQKRAKGSKTNGNATSDSSTLLSEVPNGSVVGGLSKNGTKLEKSGSVTFGGDDFIPFELYDSTDEEEGLARYSKDRKGKGKAIEDAGRSSDREEKGRDTKENHGKGGDGGPAPPWRERDSRMSERQWDKGKRPRDWDDDRRGPGSGRDMDRDRDGNRKRKYDEYQGDDRDRSTRQKFDTKSKKCPWMIGVDLEKCRNVAEM